MLLRFIYLIDDEVVKLEMK